MGTSVPKAAFRKVTLVALIASWGICVPLRLAHAEDVALRKVKTAVEHIAKRSNGVVGVGAIHLESGARLSVNGKVRFPMASVYKLPIALTVLRRVDQGQVDLNRRACLSRKDLRPGYSPLAESWRGQDICVPIRRLLQAMLRHSDNVASDYLFELAGGGEAITARLRELGIEGMRVDRQELHLISDWRGVKKLSPPSSWTLEEFDRMRDAVPESERTTAGRRYDRDPRDTSTPDAMASLLERIHRREVLAPTTHAELIKLMMETTSGPARIKGLLPPGTRVAHRTGTMGGTTNDVGIIELPGSRGHLALAVFIKSSTAAVAVREKVIATISKTIYDHFAGGAAISR